MADTTAPVPRSLSFSGTTGTLTWTEAVSPPVLNNPNGVTINSDGGIIFAGSGLTYQTSIYTTEFLPIAAGNSRGDSVTFNGKQQYHGAMYLGYIGTSPNGYWALYNYGQDAGGDIQYKSGATGSNLPPTTGWVVQQGPAPGPVGYGTNQGMVFSPDNAYDITGKLSGGAVTISNVVTTGTTTTFTTSRAIANTETGSLLGAIGAFTDSASPANATAAFSIPITSATFVAISRTQKPLFNNAGQVQEVSILMPLSARIAQQYTCYAASSTLSPTDPFQAFDTTSANFTVTLPDASASTGEFGFMDIGPASSGHTLTYQCQSGQTLNGNASGTISAQYTAFTFLPFYNTSTSAWGWLLKG